MAKVGLISDYVPVSHKTESREKLLVAERYIKQIFDEHHEIALELEAKLQFMTERCKGLERRAEEAENDFWDG